MYQIIVQCITNYILFSGVDPYLVRVSVGLEPVDELKKTFAKALQKASEVIYIGSQSVSSKVARP
jgi:hypothetical protein